VVKVFALAAAATGNNLVVEQPVLVLMTGEQHMKQCFDEKEMG